MPFNKFLKAVADPLERVRLGDGVRLALGEKKTTSAKVRQKRAAKRDEIVSHAREMIAATGPAEFSLNQLARDLGYTPGALYWYYPSKEALVGEVQRQVFSEMAGDLAARREQASRVADRRGDAPELRALFVLLSFARYYLRLDALRPEYLRLIAFSLDPRIWLDDEQGALLGPVLVQVFQQVAIPFTAASACGALSPGPAAARAVQYWAALQGIVQTQKLSRLAPGLFEPERLGMANACALLTAWGACTSLLDEASGLVRDDQPAV